MANFKKESTHDVQFAKGGDGHMFGEQAAGEVKPGETGKPNQGGPGSKFASGGATKMFGFSPSQPARAGITSPR